MARLRRKRGEEGAVVPMVAIFLTVLITMSAFAVDLGMQRVARRDMQALADVIALDMVRQIDGRSHAVIKAANTWRSALRGSMYNNLESLGVDYDDIAAQQHQELLTGTVAGEPVEVTVEMGRTSANGVFSSISYPEVPTAVRVTAETSVDFAFAPGSGGASRTAVTYADAGGCFSLGSYAARVDLGDSFILGPLLGVLGTDVDLDLLDVQGLADTHITALDLLETDLTAGGFEQMLATTVGLDDLMLATADALRANSGQTAQVQLLEDLVALPLPALDVPLGELLDLDTGSATALNAELNVLDLVAGGVFIGNGDSAIRLPLSLGVGTVTNVTVDVVIGQKPIVTCGRQGETEAQVSQVSVIVGGNLANLNLGVASISAPVSVELALDPANASLTGLRCDDGDRMLDFTVSSGLLDLDVMVGDSEDPDLLSIKAAGLNIADGYLLASGSRGAGLTETGTVTVADGDYAAAAPFEAGDGNIGLPGLGVVSQIKLLSNVPGINIIVNTLLGGLVNGVVSPLLSIVINPLVQALDLVVLSPLLESLGINLTGADVRAVPVAECALPKLVQ